MSSGFDDRLLELTARIADGENIDWDDAGAAMPGAVVAHLKALNSLYRAMRRVGDPVAGDALERWGHLHVAERIGQGGFGQVYRAFDPILQRDVALKLLPAGTPGSASGWIREARRLARVRHPNVLAVHGADIHGSVPGLWSDLLNGRTLAERIAAGPMPRAELIDFAGQLASAVAAVHAAGLVHGDIKPGNVMIEPGGRAVLMDFGAAAEAEAALPTRFGSPLLMAPETLDGKPASAASDVYAVGAVLYFAATGRYPVEAATLDELRERQARAGFRFEARTGAAPRALRGLVERMLATRPDKRPAIADAEKLIARIASAPQRMRRNLALGTITLLLAAGALAALLAYRSAAQSRDRIERVKDVLAEAAESVVPTRQSGPTSVVAMYEKLAELIEERLADYPAALAEMRVITGVSLGKLGEIERGLALAESGIELMQRVRGDVPSDLSSAWLEVATVRAMVEDIEGAEQATRNALAALSRMNPEDAAAERLTARNRLALLLGQQGRWREEVAATRDLLEERRALYGSDSVRLAVDYHNLAGAQRAVGDLDEALVNQRRAGDLLRAAGDENSVRMGFVWYALANILIDLGRFDEAAQALDHATGIYRANLPSDHPNFEYLAEANARLQAGLGRWDEAVPTLRRLAALEGDAFAWLRLRVNRLLAQIMVEREQWTQAHALYRKIQADKPRRYQPLTGYFDAAIAYTGFHAGTVAESPVDAIVGAIDQLRAAGLERSAEYQRLQRWRDSVSAQTGAGRD